MKAVGEKELEQGVTDRPMDKPKTISLHNIQMSQWVLCCNKPVFASECLINYIYIKLLFTKIKSGYKLYLMQEEKEYKTEET